MRRLLVVVLVLFGFEVVATAFYAAVLAVLFHRKSKIALPEAHGG